MTLCSRVSLPGCSNTSVTNEIFHFIWITRGDWWKIIDKILLILYNIDIRIEIHIISWHWMVKTLAILMFLRSPLEFISPKHY